MDNTENITYEQAMQRLEVLSRKMESGDVAIDEMANCLKEAQKLMAYCRKCLTDAEEKCKALDPTPTLPHEGGR